jgi:hypothetical protein
MIVESSGIIEQACGTFHVSGGLQFSSLEYDRHNELYVFALEYMSQKDTFFFLFLCVDDVTINDIETSRRAKVSSVIHSNSKRIFNQQNN